MREHAIPQDITSYRFHLIGSMTLKQFAELLVGVIFGLIFYKTNLPNFIKWPIILSFVGLGAAAAFVPIEGRPLDQWLINFLKVLYRPTKFNWKREPKIPAAFTHKPEENQKEPVSEIDYSPIRREKTKEFLQSINQPQNALDEFDLREQQQVAQILNTFQQTSVAQTEVKKQLTKPNLKVRVRKMKAFPQAIASLEKASGQASTQVGQAQPSPQPTNDGQGETSPSTPIERSTPTAPPPSPNTTFDTTTQAASQNQNLPFPNKPTEANKVVGMIINQNNGLIDNAIIEIKNQQGKTITAVKSNALGQFSISQPLANGTFYIKASKKGYGFDNLSLDLTGNIIDPLEIRSTS